MPNDLNSNEVLEKNYKDPLDYIVVSKDNKDIEACTGPVGIFMHGFGGTAEGMAPICSDMLEEVPYWILPQAPIKLFEFFGNHANAWFPSERRHIVELLAGEGIYWDHVETLDIPEMEIAAKKVISEIILPIRQLEIDRPIVLAGFSQGGMMASEIILQSLALNLVIDVALLYSTCQIARDRWTSSADRSITQGKSHVKVPPIWQAHGKDDTVLFLRQGKNLHQFWSQHTNIDFFEFEGQHDIPPFVVQETRLALREMLS